MVRACDSCGTQYEAKRPSSKYCSERCRKRAQRAPDVPGVIALITPLPDVPKVEGGISVATRLELEAVDMLTSSLGQKALLLAARLENVTADTGSSVAAIVREHGAIMQAARDSGKVAADPLDELGIRRRERRDRARA